MGCEQKLKLILHAEDGFIPFLTPYLLNTYFPPNAENVRDHLIIGIAIKDTCVVPIIRDKSKSSNNNDEITNLSNKQTQKRKRSDEEADNSKRQRTEKGRKGSNKDIDCMKPIGYAFDNQIQLSSIDSLEGYNTIVVPTFDLVDDITDFFLSKKKPKAKVNNYGKKKNESDEKDSNVQSSTDLPPIVSSSNQVTLCTPHGMQKLTSETYINITSTLESNVDAVALYDQAHIFDKEKRKQNSISRTQVFLKQIIEKSTEQSNQAVNKRFLAPLICSSTAIGKSDEDFYKNKNIQLNDTLQHILDNQSCISGIALIGWYHIESKDKQNQVLKLCSTSLESTTLKAAVLCTNSLSQIMDIAKAGINMFGCNLPARWARCNKGFALCVRNPNLTNGNQHGNILEVDTNGCIDLSNEIYARDVSPLVADCTCLLCKKYTKSYVHHLIKAKELLADIVLFGHNLHQMLLFCVELSSAREDKRIDQYCEFIENQLK